MKVFEIRPWFLHQEKSSTLVYVIFDVCHMIKLMRNLLGDYKAICDDKGGVGTYICW